MTRAFSLAIAGVTTLALAMPAAASSRHATAAHRHKRDQTGPLILSGAFGPQARADRSRRSATCVPVTIRVWP
jgi:hypothetical protein